MEDIANKDVAASSGDGLKGLQCPDCGHETVPASACRYCPVCGWGRCG